MRFNFVYPDLNNSMIIWCTKVTINVQRLQFNHHKTFVAEKVHLLLQRWFLFSSHKTLPSLFLKCALLIFLHHRWTTKMTQRRGSYLIGINLHIFVCLFYKGFCIPESLNTNILYQLFDYTITFMNSQH